MLTLDNESFSNRLWLGSAGYPSLESCLQSVKQANVEIVTVSLAREVAQGGQTDNHFFKRLIESGCQLLPNTAGCRTAKQAIDMAHMAREVFNTHWIKLECIGDDMTLAPDPYELIVAAKALLAEEFFVFPYCSDDLIVCQQLRDAGCEVIMPWAAPIGTGLGPRNLHALQTLRERLQDITLVCDAGIGKPSHACQMMEMGFDAVLVNTAVSKAVNPVQMAVAFGQSVQAGRSAYQSGMIPMQHTAQASTSLLDTPFWQSEFNSA